MLKLQHNEYGTTCFINRKMCERVVRENVEFLETKRRMYLDEMDGILV